jgi:cytochrome c biogenesis protein
LGNRGRDINYSGKAKNIFLRFFSSIKLALVLILLIGGFSLFGAFASGIDVFHSWWFMTIGFLLMVNIFVCTLNRWKSTKLQMRGAQIVRDESYYQAGKNRLEISLGDRDTNSASVELTKILKSQRYRVIEKSEKENVYLAADKNRFFRLGTLISHFSIILFVLAYLMGSYFGFKDGNLVVAEENLVDIGHNTGLSLELVSFRDTYYEDGTPQDYRSQVILHENGKFQGTYMIRVNEPLLYKDIRIYQSFFGPAVHLKVISNGQSVFNSNVALDQIVSIQDQARPVGDFTLQQHPVSLALIGRSQGVEDKLVPSDQIGLYIVGNQGQTDLKLLQKGVPLTIGDNEFTYIDDSKFSGFQVNRDPANSLIWIASILFIAGNIMVFYFPHRRLWAMVGADEDNCCIRIRMDEGRGLAGTDDLNKISAMLSCGKN